MNAKACCCALLLPRAAHRFPPLAVIHAVPDAEKSTSGNGSPAQNRPQQQQQQQLASLPVLPLLTLTLGLSSDALKWLERTDVSSVTTSCSLCRARQAEAGHHAGLDRVGGGRTHSWGCSTGQDKPRPHVLTTTSPLALRRPGTGAPHST